MEEGIFGHFVCELNVLCVSFVSNSALCQNELLMADRHSECVYVCEGEGEEATGNGRWALSKAKMCDRNLTSTFAALLHAPNETNRTDLLAAYGK